MKKVITLSLACLLFAGIGQAQAQTKENPVGLKLGIGLSGYDGAYNTMLVFSQNHVIGTVGLSYYISKHLGLALEANFFTMSNKHQATITPVDYYKTSDINLNLLLRIKPFTTRLNPYIAFGIGGNILKDRANIRTKQFSHVFAVSVPFGIGINYKISKQFSLNAQMLYNWTFTDNFIDSYPASANMLKGGGPGHPNIDGHNNDKFLLTTVGLVFNFGGGKSNKMSRQEKLFHQSMKNLTAAQNASEEAAKNLDQAQKLNKQTLAALRQLQKAQNMNKNEVNELKERFVHIVNNIQFAFNEATLLPTAKTELSSLANIMNHYPGLRVDIAGHAGGRGSRSYNKKLSKQRVQTVKEYLMSHGVSASHITTNAYGETEDLIHPSTSSADMPTVYAQNRAVQLTLSYQNPESR